MGYEIEQGATQFTVLPTAQQAARRAAQALLSPDDQSLATGGMTTGGAAVPTVRWFAFMNHTMQAFADAKTLAAVLQAWRWTPAVEEDGTITDVRFQGSRADDSRHLWEAIGPYVAPGSFIEMHGEDGAHWRWVFTGSACALVILVPSEWGPSWLRSTPTDGDGPPPRAAWQADPEAWKHPTP